MSLGNIWESRQAQGRAAGLEGHTALPWLPPHPSEALRVDAPHHQLFRSEQVPEPWRECLPPLPAAGVCPAWAPGGSPQSSLLLSTSPRWDRNKELRGTARLLGRKLMAHLPWTERLVTRAARGTARRASFSSWRYGLWWPLRVAGRRPGCILVD